MTLDAMHWVWNHSQSRGNPRIVLLAVADQVRTAECEIQLSYSDLMRALNVTSRGVVREAIKGAVALRELEVLRPGVGTRPALYRLPKATGYVRTDPASSLDYGPLRTKGTSRTGPDSGPQGPASGADSGPLTTDHDHASGPDSDHQRSGFRPSSGPESGPHYPSHSPKRERAIDTPAPASGFPDFARPLSDQLGVAGVNVRWPFSPGEWAKLHAAILKSGIPALVDYAQRSYERKRGDIDSARYFLRGWCELPPIPAAGTERPALRAVSGGFQPYQAPTDADYAKQQGF